ncbi:arf-GAP domain and FG repeat-containing protein 1-like [Pseudoliparis swirei]|uniref:arf-GAP domain and FG repeat-containing protein 1-like n=1 Tax=Pseudoliparis swirei TaxID=2059687 RepID=UPI0024BE44EC|nr:arf-GAP domain and FG repeat-containing protein 1-like [Pseudoliparis swirei]
MTTFTQQEIEFLQKNGNEVCKRTWLSLYDDRTTSIPDFREPQKVKEFLQEKYEKKRWYVPPEQAKGVSAVHVSGSSNSSTSSTPEVRPLKSLLGESAPPLQLNKNTPPNQSPVGSRGLDKRFDLLGDLGGDIFAAPASVNAANTAGFANFAQFNSHSRAGVPAGGGSAGWGALPQMQSRGDRYAALAELDTGFGPPGPATSVYNTTSTSQGMFGPVMSSAHTQLPCMAPGFGAQSTNPFVAPAAAPTNPFQVNGRAANMAAAAASFGTLSMSMPSGFVNAAACSLPTSFSGTFPPHGGAFPPGGGFPPGFGPVMSGPMVSSNPFLGAGPKAHFPSGGSSTNPFL